MATILVGAYLKNNPMSGLLSGVLMMGAGVVDQSLFGPQTKAQKMDSTQLQDSSYGNMIPILFGMARTTCNIIFATDFIPHKHKQRSGKGGGGTSTYYTYTISAAAALCKGPIAGIRRIWLDGAVYTLSSGLNLKIKGTNIFIKEGNTADALKMVNGSTYTFRKNSDTSKTVSCRVYLGTEDQMPDSYIESKNGGVGTTPAYRGLAYVVFQDLDLTDFGGRLPQMQFEVISENIALPVIYSNQTIEGQTFTDQDLSFSFFDNATVKHCIFDNCRLDSSSWNSAYLENCNFDTSIIRNADFEKSTVKSCSFAGTDARGSNFIDANVTDSNFDGADLRGASFDSGDSS